MKFELVSPTDPILLRKAEPVKLPDRSLSRLYSEMLHTMIVNNGCGLAAPQVGLSMRLFTFLHKGEVGIVINPHILEFSPEKVETIEGCLTYPDQCWKVQRSKEIVIVYADFTGEKITRRMEDQLAIIAQHETDHLDGILIPQHGQKVES